MINLEKSEPDLMTYKIMESSKACEEWGIHTSTLRKRIQDFPKGTIRKIGNSYAVTRRGMFSVFGVPKENYYNERSGS
ncbi:hypothetical protein A374_06376 [Fictibacillus macauensis ZFHKF-1]|uniref:Helix-turn-helix domain-containing protein n=1 Tax=Fictibacillus macauensis ZFHKF-1 TaxID=1196324 RepID=I8UHA2_9BACL|nr:helix-turn-helix domain-containing protein [Fictibacillus macauensis]EIT86203.1 hypothetical protein A374_06376 [Fictibacillus macauensis ZFHKF-1]